MATVVENQKEIQGIIQKYLDVIDSFYNKQIDASTLFHSLQQFVIKDKFTANYHNLKQIGTSPVDKISLNYKQYMSQLKYRSKIKIKNSSKHNVLPIETMNKLNDKTVMIKTKAIQNGKVRKLKGDEMCIFDESCIQLLEVELIKENKQWKIVTYNCQVTKFQSSKL